MGATLKPDLKAVKVFIHTSHAQQRQEERQIDQETMEAVVMKAEKFRNCGKGAHGGDLYLFRRAVHGKTVVVVAELEGRKCWIVTGYYESKA